MGFLVEAAGFKGLRLIPNGLVDDLQFGKVCHYPVRWWVSLRDASASFRVFYKTLPIVDESADVELVPQNAITTEAVAIYGAGIPSATARCGDSFGVELRSDCTSRHPVGVRRKDPADDVRLLLVDATFAAIGFAVGTKVPDDIIAIGQATRGPTKGQPSQLTAADLAGGRSTSSQSTSAHR